MRGKSPLVLTIVLVLVLIYSLSSAGAATKKVNVQVNGGPLNSTMPGGDANLAPVTLDGTNQNSGGSLGVIRVTDARGTGQGWYVTLSATDFVHDTTPTYTIPSGAGGLQVTAASVTNVSGNGGVTGNTGNLAPGPLTVMDSGSPNGRGTNETNPALSLQVPAETYLGTYSSTVTETLLSY